MIFKPWADDLKFIDIYMVYRRTTGPIRRAKGGWTPEEVISFLQKCVFIVQIPMNYGRHLFLFHTDDERIQCLFLKQLHNFNSIFSLFWLIYLSLEFNLHMWETQLNFPVVLFIYHIFFNIFVFSKLYMCLTGVCFAPNYHFHVVLLMINGTREYFLQDDTLKRAVAAYRGKSWKKIGTICYSLIHDTFCKKWPIECELDVQFFIAFTIL